MITLKIYLVLFCLIASLTIFAGSRFLDEIAFWLTFLSALFLLVLGLVILYFLITSKAWVFIAIYLLLVKYLVGEDSK